MTARRFVPAAALLALVGCAPFCKPLATPPVFVRCEATDGGPSSALNAITVINRGHRATISEPRCDVELDGGAARLTFSGTLCEESLENEIDVDFFTVRCQLPEGTWRVNDGEYSFVATVTDAGIFCR